MALSYLPTSTKPTKTMDNRQKLKEIEVTKSSLSVYKKNFEYCKQSVAEINQLEKQLIQIANGMKTCPARPKKNCKHYILTFTQFKPQLFSKSNRLFLSLIIFFVLQERVVIGQFFGVFLHLHVCALCLTCALSLCKILI